MEGSWEDLASGRWIGKVTPEAVLGSICSWTAGGIPVLLAGGRDGAARAIRGILMSAARWRLHDVRRMLRDDARS